MVSNFVFFPLLVALNSCCWRGWIFKPKNARDSGWHGETWYYVLYPNWI